MTRSALCDPCGANRRAECALHDRLVQMMATTSAVGSLESSCRGKDILPPPVALRVRVLAAECLAQPGRPHAVPSVGCHATPLAFDPCRHRADARLGERHAAVLATLPFAHDDLAAVEVHVVHSKAQTL